MALPLFNRPHTLLGDLQVFTTVSTVTNIQWLTWRRPPGCGMAMITCIGGGGGGGGGFTAAASAARGGGGGGGSSGVTSVLVPLFLLPDVLYIQVGAGGAGVGSGGGTAGRGVLSYVAVAPNTTATNVVAVSGNAAAVGGGTGTGAAVGAAGTAGTIATLASMPLAGVGVPQMIAGQVGVAGGAIAGANGTNIAIPVTSVLTTGGCGGAGTTSADFAGGTFTAIANSLLSQSAPVAPASGTGHPGSGGVVLWDPMFFFGGCGGSSSNSSVGSNGGNGAYGSGGGGGGGGTTGGTGGVGGQGIVIIYAW